MKRVSFLFFILPHPAKVSMHACICITPPIKKNENKKNNNPLFGVSSPFQIVSENTVLYLRLPLMPRYSGIARSEFKETPLKSEVSRGNSCLFLHFSWLEWRVEQQWGESCGALNGGPWEFWRKVCLVTSDGSRTGAKLISVGPFLYAAFLLLYRQLESEFAPAAKRLSASSVNVCICGAEGKRATVNHLQMSDVASRVALTGPNSLLTCLLVNTSGKQDGNL